MRKYIGPIAIFLAFLTTSCSYVDSGLIESTQNLNNQPKATEEKTNTPTETRINSSITPKPSIPTETQLASQTKNPTSTDTTMPEPTSIIEPIIRIGPDDFPDYINPLTGLFSPNPYLLDRRPIAVKIPNYPHNVYPQSGLSQADHVFEYHLEQGLTRFIAIFYGKDALRVGPIRSGRNFDAHIVQMYNSAYVFNLAYEEEGNDPLDVYGFLKRTLNERLMVIEPWVSTPWMWRDETIEGYNNLFANTYQISELITRRGIDNTRQDLGTIYFCSTGGNSPDDASVININYSYADYAYWQYNEQTKKYERYQGNVDLVNGVEPEYILLTDASNGNHPIVADNVIVLFVPHQFIYKSGLSEVFDIQLKGRGDAYVFRNGSAFEVIWKRKALNKPLYILNQDGSNFPLKPGVTFFQVITTESEMVRGGSDWTFKFIRPEEP